MVLRDWDNQTAASGLEKDARGMLSGRGSWVFSDVDGFPARKLPDYGTGDYL